MRVAVEARNHAVRDALAVGFGPQKLVTNLATGFIPPLDRSARPTEVISRRQRS